MSLQIDCLQAVRVLATSFLALSGCAPETDSSGGRASGGVAATAGTLATGGTGAAAGSSGDRGAGAPANAVPPSLPRAGAAVPMAGSGRGGRAGSGVSGNAGMGSVAGAAATGGRAAAGRASVDAGAAAVSGETGAMVGITAAHNAVRARLMNPMPSPALPPLAWSNELAAIAQAYATELASGGDCLDLVHSESDDLGENLAGYSGSAVTALEVVEGWAEEEQCYTFGVYKRDDNCDMTCTSEQNSSGCGHFTQIVWRDTSQVGCGMATCGSGRNGGEVWVCNYKAPGNYIGEKPY
jgi:pathogenesis-related protein 1